MKLTKLQIENFRKVVYAGAASPRPHMPWRTSITPYKILISEVMLQQTQVVRVVDYFNNWITLFPNFLSLSKATPAHVLKAWQGLGYNNRGLRLHELAKIVVQKYKGKLPHDLESLIQLPGIGPYTAGAIIAFAYNKPISMIETNIRRVYIHHFFSDEENVHDKDLLPIIEQTLDGMNPRIWYWALMDYGSQLPKLAKFNPNTQSKHYTKQSQFKGSMREMRSIITKQILSAKNQKITLALLAKLFGDDARFDDALASLVKDKVVRISNKNVVI